VELDNHGNPLDRIGALEFKVTALSHVVFGDERTRTESLFQKMDRLQESTDEINRRQAWMLAALLFMMGLICMVIFQMVWSATH
jgi:hypothetical protein